VVLISFPNHFMPDDGALRHLKYNYRGLKMGILFRLLACLVGHEIMCVVVVLYNNIG